MIEIYVSGNDIKQSGQNCGVCGEGNSTEMRLIFGSDWESYSKRIVFYDAHGQTPTAVLISGSSAVQTISIPFEPLKYEGDIEYVIEGSKENTKKKSVAGRLRVRYAPMTDGAGAPEDVTLTQAEQLQVLITAAEAAAKEYADNVAETAEGNAKEYADSKAQAAETAAKQYADGKTDAALTSAKEYADTKADGAESAAKQYADDKSETAEGNAKSYADSKAQAAETAAKQYADSKADAALTSAKEYADTKADGAESAAKQYADSKTDAALTSAKEYADTKANGAESAAKQYADDKAEAAEGNAKEYADTELAKKANKQDDSGGGVIGSHAQTHDGGGAVGLNAESTYGGGAVGRNAKANEGGAAVGDGANANYGAAAVGCGSKAINGGAAIGYNAEAGSGFSGGANAKVSKGSNGQYKDAIQLGTGTNENEKTLQVYDYQLMDKDGKIPEERLKPITADKIADGVIPTKVSELENNSGYLPSANAVGKKGVGKGAEIFNDYENNKASGYCHAEGHTTEACVYGYEIAENGLLDTEIRLKSNKSDYSDINLKVGDYLIFYTEDGAAHVLGSGIKVTDVSALTTVGAIGVNSTKGLKDFGVFPDYIGTSDRSNGNRVLPFILGAHAEGYKTKAIEICTHAEGRGTIASAKSQHVQGRYNEIDTEQKYAHIVGNGYEDERSNAHTVDWDGVGWFAGGLKVGGSGQDDENAKDIATVEQVNTKAAAAESSAKSYADTKAEENSTSILGLKEKSIPKTLFSGYPVFLTDCLAGEKILSCKVYGNCGKNLLNPNGFTSKGQYLMQTLCENDVKLSVSFIDKDTSVDISDVYFGFVYDTNNINFGYVWLISNGVLREKATNATTTGELNKYCGTVMIYPPNAETVEKIFKRYKIQVEFGDETTDYEPYKAVGDLDDTDNKYHVPVRIQGKNLLSYPYSVTTKTVNGITFTGNGDGTITANGTATADAAFGVYPYDKKAHCNCPAGDYIISGCPSGGSFTTYYINYAISSNSGGIKDSHDTGKGLKCTMPNGTKYIYATIKIKSGTVCENLVFKPQLEYGTVVTEYEIPMNTVSAEAALDTPLSSGEHIDFIRKKRVSGGTETAVTVTGELTAIDSGVNNILCGTATVPGKIDIEYFQDINKVLAELKAAVSAQGGNA